MPNHTPPTWFLERVEREEPTDAVPVGETPALAAAYERAMGRHLASIRSLEPTCLGTCAAKTDEGLEPVIAALQDWPQWKDVVQFLEGLMKYAQGGMVMRTLRAEQPRLSHAGAVGELGTLGMSAGLAGQPDPARLGAEKAMASAKQMPSGWIAYAASFLPDDPGETLRVLRDDAEQFADTVAYGLLKEWAEEAIQKMPESCRWSELEEQPPDLQGDDHQCPGD